MQAGRVEQLSRRDDGTFDAVAGSARLHARFVLLATGARDIEPDIPGLAPHCAPGQGVTVELQDGRQLAFDVLYPALGLTHACQLATALGARAQDDEQLEVDAHFQTSVPRLYAAGDVAVGFNQINVAAGQAAIAATDIHNRL